MTSFYSWRLIFMTFYGKERGDHHTHEHAHESPLDDDLFHLADTGRWC